MLCKPMHAEGHGNEMAQIVLTRIDNRLIHGQIVTEWCSYVQADVVLVANDAVARDSLRQSLMKMAAPASILTRYYTLAQTIQVLKKSTSDQRVVLLCETPQDILTLVKGGVPIQKVNVGNMHMAKGKHRIATTVAIDENDQAVFRKLKEYGVEFEIRRTPQCAIEKSDALC